MASTTPLSGGGKAVVAIFSLEMSKEELGFRFLSMMSRIDSKRLKIGRISSADDWGRLAKAADQLSKSKIFIDDSGDLTVMDIRSRCRRLVATEKRVDLIVVDYLQLMKGSKAASKGDGSREREISEISRNLKNLAKELKVPIIALSQLNRGVESRPNKRPMLSDLRESGAIEQDADIVCFIYRDEVYNKETEDRGIAELIVAKHRAGETATIRLAWLAEYTLFANLAATRRGRRSRRRGLIKGKSRYDPVRSLQSDAFGRSFHGRRRTRGDADRLYFRRRKSSRAQTRGDDSRRRSRDRASRRFRNACALADLSGSGLGDGQSSRSGLRSAGCLSSRRSSTNVLDWSGF